MGVYKGMRKSGVGFICDGHTGKHLYGILLSITDVNSVTNEPNNAKSINPYFTLFWLFFVYKLTTGLFS